MTTKAPPPVSRKALLARFYAYYLPYRILFVLDFSSAILSGLLELGFPMAVKYFVDHLLTSQQWVLILMTSAGLLALYLINTGLLAVVTYWGHMLGINIETDMRREAFNHLQKLSFSYFDRQKTGHLVGRLTKDLEEIGEVAHHGPEDLFIAVMTLIGAMLLMFSVNWQLALLTTIIVPSTAWVTQHFGGRMVMNFHKVFQRIGEFNVRIEENIGGMRVVQAFANETHEAALFERENQSYRGVKLEAYRLLAMSNSLSYMTMRLTQLVVMVAGAYLVLTGDLTAGGFIGFLLLINVFFQPIQKISSVFETYPKGIAGFRRFIDLMETRPDIPDAPDALDIANLRGFVAYRNVAFGYSLDKPVLKNVNLTIDAGETIAFVGPSGAGKTTICSLLPRFYEVDAGSISIDGLDIRQMTKASLRQQIGVVQQDVFLFGGTIRENIAYGRLDASEAEIREAARRARLDEVLADLPSGLDTVVGERGVKLSGGQRQRVAIARMFLKNPPILILDEATSALDIETEQAIQRSLAELSAGRTTLIIAHRLATIQGADRIVVIDGRGIIEQGTHEELLSHRATYSRLYESQSF